MKVNKKFPQIEDLPLPPTGKKGWPWDQPKEKAVTAVLNRKPFPKISIITPCFNAVKFIEESIRSVLLQNYPNLEYIVIDGGSTDGTVEIIKKYEKFLTYWESRKDRGQTHAIKKGLAKASGTFFNWHNADDILLPDSLFETVEGFLRYPDAVYLCRPRLLLGEDGNVVAKGNASQPGLVSLKKALIHMCPGGQPGGLMRRDLANSVGGLDEAFDCAMDEDLMMRMRLEGPGYYLEEPGIIFRVHADQKSELLTHTRIKDKFGIASKVYSRISKENELWDTRYETYLFAHRWAASLLFQNGYIMNSWFHRFAYWGWFLRKFVVQLFTTSSMASTNNEL